jgi:putative transcriptional regulator
LQCGERVVSIPAINQLRSKIAAEILRKKSVLTGKKIRFLRKNMGLTARRLADIMGINNATVSRWENGQQTIKETHDRLLRLVYVSKMVSTEKFKHLIEKDFEKISPQIEKTPPYMIPENDWSKSSICFSE